MKYTHAILKVQLVLPEKPLAPRARGFSFGLSIIWGDYMGKMFLMFHPYHVEALGSDRAEVYYENLVRLSKFADNDGWFTRSTNQIQKDIKQKRSIQDVSRRILIEKGWIICDPLNGLKSRYKVVK